MINPDIQIPSRIAKLAKDARGYPVPFFVAFIDGVPDFRVADPYKKHRCLENDLCWLCGEKLGIYKCFVIGPMCAINRNTAEPPSHLDCAQFAVKACPFLSKPKVLRVPDEKMAEGCQRPGGIPIDRNPGVSLIWITETFTPYNCREKGHEGVLIHVGKPSRLEWYKEGRRATRAEVEESINTGLPIIRKVAEEQGPEAIEDLEKKYEAMKTLLPD